VTSTANSNAHDDGPTPGGATSITSRLAAARGTIRRRRLIAAAVMTCGLIAVGAMLLDGVNRFLPLRESWAFAAMVVVGGVGVASLLRQWLLALFRAGSTVDLALLVEQHRPDFMDALVCAAEIEGRPAPERRSLEKALLDKMTDDTKGFDFLAAVFPRGLRWNRLALHAALFIAIAVAALGTEPLAKAFFFLKDLAAGAQSGLIVTPGDCELPEHGDVRVDVRIRRWRNEAEIVYSGPETQRFLMNRGEGRRHFFTFYDVTEPIRYRVVTPALATPWYTLEPFRPPVILRAEMRIDPPAYTGREAAVFPELRSHSAVVGSRIRISLETAPGVSATLDTDDAKLPFVQREAGALAIELPLTEDLTFVVTLESPEGRTAETPEYTVKAEPDLPPIVEALRPRRDVQAKAEQKVDLEARASDDFGLRRVALSYAISGGPRQEVALFEAPQPPGAPPGAQPGKTAGAAPTPAAPAKAAPALDRSFQHVLDLAQLNAKEGDVVSYLFVAQDNREPDPQLARSDVFFIVVRPEPEQKESPSDGKPQEVDVSGLIAEQKRLIRMTWDVLAAPADEREPLADELLRSLKDLRLETQRKFHELLKSIGGMARPLLQLLLDAAEEMHKAETLIARALVEESLPPQERSLTKLVTLENELIKNAARGQKGDGGEESDKPPQDQEQQASERQKQSRQAKLEALREMLKKLRDLTRRQDRANQSMARTAAEDEKRAAASALARTQRDIGESARAVEKELERISEASQAAREVKTATGEMDKGAGRLESGDLATGKRHGERAHNFLLAAVRSVEESFRQASANQVAQLARRTQQLADAQRGAANASRSLAEAQQPRQTEADKARERQQDLNAAEKSLESEINRTAAELEDAYPDAAKTIGEALREARGKNLAGKMTRAANALLYRRFDKARRSQVDSANILQQVASRLTAASKHLPAVSKEELLEAINQLRQSSRAVQELTQGKQPNAAKRLEQVRRQAARRLDGLAGAMQDPTLQRVAEELSFPAVGPNTAQTGRRLLTLFRAATAVLEKHLFAAEVKRKLGLSRQTTDPPEKYRRLVEEYFKDLSREK